MSPLRRFSLAIVTSLFRLTLFFGISLITILLLLGTSKPLEKSLLRTGAYQQFIPAVVQSIKEANKDKQTIPFDDPGVKKIINNAFPPADLQSKAEMVIGNSYDWLNGKAPSLMFKLDFTNNRQRLAADLSAYAFNRLAAQPLCITVPDQINPFTANCLPRNFSLKQQQTVFTKAIRDLLPQTVFTADQLPRLSNGKRLTTDYPTIPNYFQLLRLTPYVFTGLLIILSALLIGLSRNTRKGFKLFGSVVLSSGIALVTTPILYILVYPQISKNLSLQSTSTSINLIVNNIVQDLSHSFYNSLIKASLLVINFGLVILLIERFSRSKAYANISQKTGLASSDLMPDSKNMTETSLTANTIPLQTSEAGIDKKASKRWRAYRKLHDKEL